MIQTFVDRFIAVEDKTRRRLAAEPPASYIDLVRLVIETVTADEWDDESPDPERIHVVNDGDWQGTLVFVIGAKGYQPHDYWYVKVAYGSCSGCDTFQAVADDSAAHQVQGFYTLALHIVQGLKAMA